MFNTLIYIPFFNILVFLIAILPGHSSALAIIVFTLIIRFILLIPNRHALENQKKMQVLQPEIEKLKKEYKDNQQEMAKATMELYQSNNISPFGSCLPILIQLPIFIVLYKVLQAGFGEQTLSQLYSFVPRPEFINPFLFGIDLTVADTTLILPILAAGFQFIQVLATLAISKKRGQKMPGMGIMYFFVIMTFFISLQVNAGVVLYWVVSTVFGIVQQVFVNRHRTDVVHTDELALPKPHKHPTKVSDNIAQEEKSSKKGIEITVRRPQK